MEVEEITEVVSDQEPLLTRTSHIHTCPTCGWKISDDVHRLQLTAFDGQGRVVEASGVWCLPCGIRRARELGLLTEMVRIPDQQPAAQNVSV